MQSGEGLCTAQKTTTHIQYIQYTTYIRNICTYHTQNQYSKNVLCFCDHVLIMNDHQSAQRTLINPAQMQQSGAYLSNQSTSQTSSILSGTWPNPRFPPAPPSSPPTLAYPVPPRLATPPCSPTLPCPPTQAVSPSTPSVPSSQPRHTGTPHMTSPGGHTTLDDNRTYGFDLNPH